MSGKLIIHIPHSSTSIPDEYMNGILLSEEELASELLWATDSFCDELFDAGFGTRIVAEYSRLVCDVERMRNDSDEPYAQKGNGLLYTLTQRGALFRNLDNALREKVLEDIYDPHHAKLTSVVDEALSSYGMCLIIDLHSFCDDPCVGENLPDFCIGTDEFHTPKKLYELAQAHLIGKGYTVSVNYPYSGSMVPAKYYRKDKRVISMMIEVNKRLYLDCDMKNKSGEYLKTKQIVTELITSIFKSI